MDKQKKVFLIGGIIEGAVLIFDLIVSIRVWTTMIPKDQVPYGEDYEAYLVAKNGGLIGKLQANPTLFFFVICIPLFLIIALDFIYFAALAAKKESKLSDAQLEAIKSKAKAQAEEELRRELEAEALKELEEEAPKAEEKAPEPAPEEPKKDE